MYVSIFPPHLSMHRQTYWQGIPDNCHNLQEQVISSLLTWYTSPCLLTVDIRSHINSSAFALKNILYDLLSYYWCEFVINPFPASQISFLKHFNNFLGYCCISLWDIQVQVLHQPYQKLFAGTFGYLCAFHLFGENSARLWQSMCFSQL